VDVTVDMSKSSDLGLSCETDCGGLWLNGVAGESPAAFAGLTAYVGWRLHAINSEAVGSMEDVKRVSRGKTRVSITLVRPSCDSSSRRQRDMSTVPSENGGLASAVSHSGGETPPELTPLTGVQPHILDIFGIDPSALTIDKDRILGKGSYGMVYLGDYQATEVAVKVHHSAFEKEIAAEDLLEWRREVKVMTRLRHPNILMFVGASFQETKLMIVTELCDKGSLREVINMDGAPYIWLEKVAWGKQIAMGMAHLHHKNVHHCDLKSSNVFVSGETLKIADFGLSKVVRRHSQPSLTDSLGLLTMEQSNRPPRRDPQTGRRTEESGDDSGAEIPGTFAFIAPEVWAEEPFTTAADVYSYGILLLELIARRPPWDEDEGARSWRLMTGRERPVVPTRISGTEVPPAFVALVRSCLAFEKTERPAFSELTKSFKALTRKMDALSYPAPWPRGDEKLVLSEICEVHEKCAGWE